MCPTHSWSTPKPNIYFVFSDKKDWQKLHNRNFASLFYLKIQIRFEFWVWVDQLRCFIYFYKIPQLKHNFKRLDFNFNSFCFHPFLFSSHYRQLRNISNHYVTDWPTQRNYLIHFISQFVMSPIRSSPPDDYIEAAHKLWSSGEKECR